MNDLNNSLGKYVVLLFYPMDFAVVYPTEILAFSDRMAEFEAVGCSVIACSSDSHFSGVVQDRKHGVLVEMKIPLLADKNMSISRAYGVLKEDEGLSFRGLFIIDGHGNTSDLIITMWSLLTGYFSGKLRQMTINDLPVGRDVDETLRLVQAFQFTDKHGEVCPAGWKPGKATMVPNPKDSLNYFQQANANGN